MLRYGFFTLAVYFLAKGSSKSLLLGAKAKFLYLILISFTNIVNISVMQAYSKIAVSVKQLYFKLDDYRL